LQERGFQAGREDLEDAKRLLINKKLTFCAVKHDEILFESKLQGVASFLVAIEKVGSKLEGASVADKVVGKAVALLCVHSKIKHVFAGILSKEAGIIFENHSITFESDEVVDNILNISKKSICPFELLVKDISDPDEAYRRLVDASGSKKPLGLMDEGRGIVGERERFISEDDEELKSIREKKLTQLKARRQMSHEPVHVTDADFDETVKKHPLALIDFWASWCGPCRSLAPTIEELSRDYAGKVFVGKLDVDENPAKAECFQVFSIPTLLIIKNGQEVERIVGCVPKKQIEAALKKHMV
jgi:thioredoxin 1